MKTRQEKVLDALTHAARTGMLEGRVCRDGWVDGYLLCHPAIGGSEGLRRVRELRAKGHDIELRPHPVHGRTSRQYRIVEPATLL